MAASGYSKNTHDFCPAPRQKNVDEIGYEPFVLYQASPRGEGVTGPELIMQIFRRSTNEVSAGRREEGWG